MYDYAIFYNEDYSEFDIDYELCDVWEELGAYRIVLLDFRIYSGDIDITESIKDGTNILNGGNTHTFDDEEYPYVGFTINKISVSIAPKSQTLTRAYNGERLELTEDFYRILDGSILVDKGHILVVGGNDYLEGTVGNKKVQFDPDKIKVVVRTGSGMEIDVTKYYNIKSTYAEIGDMGGKVKEYMFTVTLIITKKTVNVVMPTEEEYFYSGISLHTIYEGPSVLTDDPEYNIYLRDMTELVDGHYIYITNPENSNSNKKCTSIPNQLSNKNYIIYDANGNDVTKNYVVNSVEGKLIVKPSITITFKSASAEKVKDGEPLTCPEIESITIYDERNDCYYTWDEFASITGFEYATSKWASEDKVGKYENTFNVDFYNSSGAKITPVLKLQYGISVEKEYGELWIKRNL